MSIEQRAREELRGGGILEGRRVLVVGGGSRMGLAVAKLAAASGAEVIVSGRSRVKLEAAAASVGREVGTSPSVEAVDFSRSEEASRLLEAVSPLDHLIVTASADAPASGVVDTPPEVARAAFSRFWISYNALHLASWAVRPTGSVTLLSGSSGRRPAPGYGVWGTLHGSIEALARNAALELAPIRVNVVSPGGIGMPPDRQLARHAGRPEDVAAMVLAVMTNPAVTGAVVDVDGGERLGTWSGR